MKRNIKLLIEYDGTNYSGWQKQKNKDIKTIQGTIEKCICTITGENVELIGCSRTDAGVHAKGFVANFVTESKIPGEKFKYAVNSSLPEDIIILDSEEVNTDFHARYNCIGKRYVYKILNRKWPSPIKRNYTYHCKNQLNINDMNKAAKYIVGKHDFSAFRNLGSSVKSTVRTVNDLVVVKNKDIVDVIISGDGFLYNMVKIIVGTLIDIGIARKKPEDIIYILNSKDREQAGKTMPSRGLYLDEVFYKRIN